MLALPEILWFALLFFSFALVYVLRKFITAMLGTLIAAIEQIPFAGDVVGGWLQSIEQEVSRVLGSAEHKIDAAIGSSFHLLARYMNRLWHHLVWSAHVLAQSAEAIAELAYEHLGIKRAVHSMAQTFRGIEHGVKDLFHESLRIQRRVKTIERTIAHGIGHDLRIHIRALERRVHGIEHGVIPELRTGIRTAEGEVTQLENFIGAIPGTKYLAWAAGIVTIGLGTLGLGWLRCPSNPFNNNKNACNLWGDLAGLLGLVTTVLVAEDFEQLVREMQAVEGETIGVIENLFNIG